jgi:hypothetical protein
MSLRRMAVKKEVQCAALGPALASLVTTGEPDYSQVIHHLGGE